MSIAPIEYNICRTQSGSPIKCRRRIFSAEDDSMLRTIVIQKGIHDWHEVAKCMVDKTARQCRDRWVNYLSPDISFLPWTREEDETIVKLVNELGTKWVRISRVIPGRSDNSIKNRWYSGLRNACVQNEDGTYTLVKDVRDGGRNRRSASNWDEKANILRIKNNDHKCVRKTDYQNLMTPCNVNKVNDSNSHTNSHRMNNLINESNNEKKEKNQVYTTVIKTANIKRVFVKKKEENAIV